MRARWVTFDCFGTLVDWNTGFSCILSPFFGSRTVDVLRAYHEFERQLEAERPHRRYRDVLAAAVALAAAKLGASPPIEAVDALPRLWPSLPVFADVEEMLAGLRAMDCRLAVLTNCDDDLFEQTQRAFQYPFDVVVTAQRVQSYKPSPAHFHRFSEVSGVARRDWVHVACSWFHDIAPAKALGISRVWLDRGLTGQDATAASARVLSASEVCPAVENLFAGV